MSSTFAVSTDSLLSSSTDVARISGEIERLVAMMMTRLTALQDEWTGTASAGFQEVVTEWRGTQEQVRANLEQIGLVLGQASDAYEQAEAASRAMMGR